MFGWRGDTFRFDGFVSQFGILAQVANDCGPVVNELDALDGAIADETTDGVGGNVAEASVECVDVNLFDRACAGTYGVVGMLDFVKPIQAGGDDSNDFAGLVFNLAGAVFEGD
jgi:hypothetical protein